MNLSVKQKIIFLAIIVGIILIAFVAIYKYYYSNEDSVNIDTKESIANEEDINDTNEDGDILGEDNEKTENDESRETKGSSRIGIAKEEKKIKVYVVGEVNSPGVVSLKEKARIVDAIDAAGGKTENADLTKINLAYILEDGVQIYVPKIGEKANEKESYITYEAGEGVITDELVSTEKKASKVNINTANSEKLQTVPGVGQATAEKIIKYRNEKGKFQKAEDIKNVEGIGDSKYEKMKDYIDVK